MNHGASYRRLNRTHEHRKALFANMAGSLIEHEQIKTTLPKAKELKPIVEKLVTLAKRGDLHARRLAARVVQDRDVLKKLFDDIGPRFAERPGGYTRILKTGFRPGDNAPMSILELVERKAAESPTPAAEGAARKAEGRKLGKAEAPRRKGGEAAPEKKKAAPRGRAPKGPAPRGAPRAPRRKAAPSGD